MLHPSLYEYKEGVGEGELSLRDVNLVHHNLII